MRACMFSHTSHVQLFVITWTVALQAPPSMGLSRQEYWSGLPFPSPGDLPDPGIKSRSPSLLADSLSSDPLGKPHTMKYQTIKKKKGNNAICSNMDGPKDYHPK